MRVATIALLMFFAAGPARPQEGKPPFSPEESARRARLTPGLRLELVASEPQVHSPVAIAFGADGTLYAVEMLDYPNADMSWPPLGRIKALRDRDGDGRYEDAVIFADRLLMANGVQPWKDGLIVTSAPDVLHLRDTDGDGKADRRDVLYRGFAVKNPQLRHSFPTFSIDNWIYVANGTRGGKIAPKGRPAASIDINGMDFRFDPVRAREEAVSGYGQFGLTFDDWGQRFVCTNRNHLIHLPMEDRYFKRNPFLAAPRARGNDQREGGASRVFPISRNKTLAAHHAGYFTASCGVFVYRGSLLPGYRGNAFTCEPTGNLIHREIMTPTGATFDSKPARKGVEFLASTDEWFRPVSMAEGPDGALYVVDMYREEVEHPQWVRKDQRYRYNFDHRKDFGRIWRIVPEKGDVPRVRPALHQASTAQLVARLESDNAWDRMTGHRILMERMDRDSWGPLRTLVAESTRPRARLHAAWILDGHRSLDVDLVLRLLEDSHPRIRETAVLLSERWIRDLPAVQQRVAERAKDSDGRVRFQAALTLGFVDHDRILRPLAQIARRAEGDRWTRMAVASAVPERSGRLIETLLSGEMNSDVEAILPDLSIIAGSRRDKNEIARLVRKAADSPMRMTVLNGLAEGMGRRGTRLSAFLETLPEGKALSKLLLDEAARQAKDASATLARRVDAVRLLAHVPWETASPILSALLTEPASELRLAAVASLSTHGRPEVSKLLMDRWKLYLPAGRREVLEAMSRRSERIEFLLGEVEAGRVNAGELGATLIRRLTSHSNAKIRARARKALQRELPEERKKVLARYQPAVDAKGDVRRGAEVFRKNCASCHRLGSIGTQVGPSIADTLSRTRAALLGDILDPSAAIDTGYVNYLVRTKAGNVLSGFIAEQSSSSITLRRGADQQDVVLRQDIDQMRSSGVSLMPEGLEKNITVEQMADLLSFVKGWRELESGAPR